MPTEYWFSASHEQFPPSELLRQAIAAERAGFDAVGCSDHFQPWWPGGESGHAWVWLGAAAQATERVPVGTGVTAIVHRYHPATVAQAFMTLEEMYPDRVFLGVGSGEALNEVPCGMEWPDVEGQLQRMEEALDVITRLWAGETVSHDGWFRCNDAVLHTHPGRRPPIYVSAFGPKAACLAGRWGDGVWTLADPESTPGIIDAYRSAAEDCGREPGKVILHAGFSWARSDEEALAGARGWKAAQPAEYFTADWHDPARMREHAEQQVSDEDLCSSWLISSDTDEHVERVREIEGLGADVVCLQCVAGADPLAAIEVYGEKVLPAVRGSLVS